MASKNVFTSPMVKINNSPNKRICKHSFIQFSVAHEKDGLDATVCISITKNGKTTFKELEISFGMLHMISMNLDGFIKSQMDCINEI